MIATIVMWASCVILVLLIAVAIRESWIDWKNRNWKDRL